MCEQMYIKLSPFTGESETIQHLRAQSAILDGRHEGLNASTNHMQVAICAAQKVVEESPCCINGFG